MKCFTAVVLLCLFAVALAKPLETESLEPANAAAEIAPEAESSVIARDKRGLLISGAYTAPIAYSAYPAAPVAYTAAYKYPAYTAYTGYPYYAAAYTSPYYVL